MKIIFISAKRAYIVIRGNCIIFKKPVEEVTK